MSLRGRRRSTRWHGVDKRLTICFGLRSHRSGRPLRLRKTPWVEDWEENRQDEIRKLTAAGKVPRYAFVLNRCPRRTDPI